MIAASTLHSSMPRRMVALVALSVALGCTGYLNSEPAEAPTEESPETTSKTELSAEATKNVGRYMNLVLEDPQNQFAFDQVYEIYESEKKTWKLLEFFQSAAKLDRKNGNLQILLGLMYVRFRDYYKAAEHFQKALVLQPQSYYARLMQGRVFLKRSDSVKAAEYLADAVNAASSIGEQVEALFLLGDALMLEKRGDEAKKAWTRIQELQRFDVSTLQRLSRKYLAYDFHDETDSMLVQILDLAEKDPRLKSETLLRRAKLQQLIGKRELAIQYLEESRSLLLPHSARRKEVEDRIRALYAEDARLDDFFTDLEEQVQERPNDINLRKEIARHYESVEQLEKSSEHLRAGTKIDTRDVLLLEQAARVYQQVKDADAAIGALDNLYTLTGGAPTYRIDLANILWDKGDKDAARAAWEKVVVDDPESPSRYQNVIRAYREHGLKDEALSLYGRLDELLRDLSEKTRSGFLLAERTEVRLAFADYLLSIEKKKEATEQLQALSEDADATPALFLQMADLYESYEMTDELVQVLDKGIERYPLDHRIAGQKGYALEGQQKYEEAIQLFLKAYYAAPNWRDKEALMDKLISLHLAKHSGEQYQGLSPLVKNLYEDLAKEKHAEGYVGLARIASVFRPTAEYGFKDREIQVPGLSKITDDWSVDYFGIGQLAAVRNYGKALDLDPMRIDAYVGRARSFMFFDEFEKAVVEYKKLSIVNPVGKWKYYFAIGDFFASQGQMPEAAAFWGRVAERAFTDADLYFRLSTRYYWAQRPKRAIQLLHKAISIYPDNYRYYLALGNMHANAREYEEAITAYRDALQRSVQTMLLPVRRIMSQTQVKYAHSLFGQARYEEALEVYKEIARFQEVMNKHLGSVVPDFPDIRTQILRTEAKIAGRSADKAALADLAVKFPSASCWVSDQLQMSIDYFNELQATGFEPKLQVVVGKSDAAMPTLEPVYAKRVYPWVLQGTFSESRIHLTRRYTQVVLDTASGKLLKDTDRSARTVYFGDDALQITGDKLRLSETATDKTIWEVDGSWYPNALATSDVLVGLSRQRGAPALNCLDRRTGKLLWTVPSCEEFRVTDKYVSIKRVKKWLSRTGGLEDHAHGDTDSIGYTFHVLDSKTGKAVFEHSSSGSHFWRVPVVVGDLVLLTDGFAHKVYAHDLATGKIRWTALFENFFAREPILLDGDLYLYMRVPKEKTIIQYVLDPRTGNIRHATDLELNSLYSRPVVIGQAIYFFDPSKFEIIAVGLKSGGVIGRTSVKKHLSKGAYRFVIAMEGIGDSLFLYTQDGLVLRLKVGA